MTLARVAGHADSEVDPQRSTTARIVLVVLALLAFAGFTALGVWQLQRRMWKLDLIERVNARISAPPVDALGVNEWSHINAATAEYRHVQVRGRFLSEHTALVNASTSLGSGYWLLMPFQTDAGFIVLINRGFVPMDWRSKANTLTDDGNADITLTGLLRISEPDGDLFRRNRPKQQRWYSRDVAAIAESWQLNPQQVAPYFVDAAAAVHAPPNTPPIAGLTVVHFYNQHLTYAITWFTLALLPLGFVMMTQIRGRR